MLVNVPRLITAYYAEVPDASVPAQRVVFGTSGHRGSAFDKAFNESHILAITQAICLYREQKKINAQAMQALCRYACLPRGCGRRFARSSLLDVGTLSLVC